MTAIRSEESGQLWIGDRKIRKIKKPDPKPPDPLMWYSEYHHLLGHNIGFGLLLALIGFTLSVRRWTTAGLVLVSFHLHLLSELLGSRSPDGYHWSIPYLLPFSKALQLSWGGQWELNAWQNFVVTGL